jgi:hypothetical protein
LPDGRIGYFFKYHHIVVDALTVSILNRQIRETYRALLAGSLPAAEEYPSYLEFFERERQYLASSARDDEEAFWRSHLAGLDPGDDPPRSGLSIRTERYEHELDPALSASVEALCKRHETTVFRFFLSLFAVHFAGGSYGRDIVLGTGQHNRLTPREKAMVGMTVSTLPMRLPIWQDDSFAGLMRRVHAVSDGCLSRQRYPYDLLSQHLRSAGADPQRLLRWFVNFIPSVSGGADEPTVERYSPGADLAELNFKINPNQRPRSAPLQLCVDARTALYGEQDIRTLFARVEALARQVLVRADEPLSRLDRITAAERSALPAPRITAPSPKTLLQQFEAVAARHPEAVAVVDTAGTLTYSDILAEAKALAAELGRQGVRRGDRVAVISERDATFVVRALAVMLAGAAYVPITPDTPEHRRAVPDSRWGTPAAEGRRRGTAGKASRRRESVQGRRDAWVWLPCWGLSQNSTGNPVSPPRWVRVVLTSDIRRRTVEFGGDRGDTAPPPAPSSPPAPLVSGLRVADRRGAPG